MRELFTTLRLFRWNRLGQFFVLILLMLGASCATPDDEPLGETAVPVNELSPETEVETTIDQASGNAPGSESAESPVAEESTGESFDVQPVTVQQIGFSQVGSQLGYGVIFHNSNRDFYVQDVLFNIKVFDANGNRLKMHVEKLDLIGPEERRGVGGTILLEENQIAYQIFVKIDGQGAALLTAPTILGFYNLPQNVAYDPVTQTASADGFIVNSKVDDSDDTVIRGTTSYRVVAVAFDAGGNIVGGGQESINPIVRNGTVSPASVSIPIITSQVPATIELFANQGHRGGLCPAELARDGSFANADCPLSTHTGG